MEWDFFATLGIFAVLGLGIQLLVFVQENWFDTAWRGLRKPVTLKQILTEWATYMLLFAIASMLMRGALHLTCSIC